MNFRVGQKVVCVRPIDDLIKDEIYTISSVIKHPIFGDFGVQVAETECKFGYEFHFKAERFEPVKLDYSFVEDVIKQVTPKEIEA